MKKLFIFLLVPALFLWSCSKSEAIKADTTKTDPTLPEALPTVSTSAVSLITASSGKSGGAVSNDGGTTVTSRGICYSLKPSPTKADLIAITSNVTTSGSFTSQLSSLTPSTKYYLRAYATNKVGTAYGEEVQFTTNEVLSATFSIMPMFIIGSTAVAADIAVLTDGGDAITEKGVCWGTSVNPTVSDSKLKQAGNGTGKFRTMITGLTERTNYHLRAYTINRFGISYSENISFRTIAKGRITYTFNKAAAPTAVQLEAYGRLQIAIDSAVWYLTNFTSATKHVYLNYDPGVLTADANNEGWMRFGPSTGVQNIRTMLHEMNHTLGTGTSSWWSGKLSAGKYQGANANAMLKKIDNSAVDVQLSGDSQHWWPYGLNQNAEVTSSWDYVYNCLIIEAMRKDGLTQYSGGYTP
ncbi:hypothetical protein LPB86_14835 [Pedobacter sp. MC2016-14]|uniref:hypothetical protein n=1 Tax=Pedobacter sp. MC2016-14 TaxID=2897327 RepID=UPI001E372CDC|nr:hypothetical protein [Pedobacter sp. MC2016-14]MCD0489515.1 hypothetical protein [Pedobacter sp. MC2016-14]